MIFQRKVFIAGVAETRFGRHSDDFDVLGRAAAIEALRASNIVRPDMLMGSAYVGNATNGLVTGQTVLKDLGMCGRVPIINVESACSAGGMAVHMAVRDIATGQAEIAIGIGCENHTLHMAKGIAFSPATSDIETVHGAVMTGKYAMRAQRYMVETGATVEDLALVTVKNRRHAKNNPFAWFKGDITVEEVIQSRCVASPLTLQQCCGIADGAAAVVVCSEEMIRKLGVAQPIRVAGSVVRSGTYHNRPRDITSDDITQESAAQLYRQSGIGPQDVDIVELHDAFTIAELLYYECLGLCAKGEGLAYLRDGKATHGGICVVNPRGGMLSYGHPIGASGAAQIAACVKQMRDQCSGYQVQSVPRVAMTHVTGGGLSGTEHAACTMHMLVSEW